MNDPIPGVIQYRHVFNDVNVRDWEPVEGIDRQTLQGLVEYLKSCASWDYHNLTDEYHSWDSHVIAYGANGQFWLPNKLTQEDWNWLQQEKDKEVAGSFGVFGDLYFLKMRLITGKVHT